MKIESVHLKHFKRFTDLTIQNIPETAKLVILAGPNGCGKTSLFDALKTWHKNWKGSGGSLDPEYHYKKGIKQVLNLQQAIEVKLYGEEPQTIEKKKKALYVRTAYRNDPQFKLNRLSKSGPLLDEERFNTLIENDVAVSGNYQRLASQAFKEIFVDFDKNATIGEFRKYVIGEIQASIQRVFPDLHLNDLGDPLEDGTFFFDKGMSKNFDYSNLSGGEKAAFDIVLDLVVKTRDYNDTVFCIDEPELHMNTRLQGALLQEMCDLLNDKSQLWIATHSIGMMRKGKNMATANPGTVVFLDFDKQDFDQIQIMEPIKPNRAFWEDVLRVALDDLADLVVPKQVVICEGVPHGTAYGPNVAFDAECLNRIFSDEFPDTKFLPGGNWHEVVADKHALIGVIEALAQGVDIVRIIDRDDRSKEEIQEIENAGIRVLSIRNLECYFFDDEVLDALCDSVNKEDKKQDLRDAKSTAVAASVSRGNPNDDLKRAAGEIYIKAKTILGLTGMGSDQKSFMRSTLAPLIKPEMKTYKTLKKDIFQV